MYFSDDKKVSNERPGSSRSVGYTSSKAKTASLVRQPTSQNAATIGKSLLVPSMMNLHAASVEEILQSLRQRADWLMSQRSKSGDDEDKLEAAERNTPQIKAEGGERCEDTLDQNVSKSDKFDVGTGFRQTEEGQSSKGVEFRVRKIAALNGKETMSFRRDAWGLQTESLGKSADGGADAATLRKLARAVRSFHVLMAFLFQCVCHGVSVL